ncbi:MAG: hypothetical protein NT167_30920 [Verrucomicrobia bacterium]|nr:hypothetical protein [Verrucomicrobiota bacterium]
MPDARTAAVSGTRDWTRVTTVFHLFGGWGQSTGQAWYDDVSLERLESQPSGTQATVTIDTGAHSITYSPMIFGGFLEHFDGGMLRQRLSLGNRGRQATPADG